MNENDLNYINEIIKQREKIESIKSAEEYKKLNEELQDINNNINSYDAEEKEHVEAYRNSIITKLKKYDEKYNFAKKTIEVKIKNFRTDFVKENEKITERIKELKGYRENLKISINKQEEIINSELKKEISEQDTDIIQQCIENLKLFRESFEKINSELIKNVKSRNRNQDILKKLTYDNIVDFSSDIEELKKKREEERKLKEAENKEEDNKEENIKPDVTTNIENMEPDIITNVGNGAPILENENSNNSEKKLDNKKLCILVNDKGYCVDGVVAPKKLNSNLLENDKKAEIEKYFYNDDYEEIMSNLKNRRARKNYDPNLLKILYNKLGKEAAIQYLQELSKGRKANKELLPYEVTYDIKSIKRNKQIKTKKQLRNMIRIARKNKYVANVIERNRHKALKYGSIGLLAAGIGLISNSQGMTNQISKENEFIGPQNEYSDSITPGEDAITEKEENNEEKDFKESLKVDVNENIDLAQKQIDDLIQKLENIQLGDQVMLEEGVNYTEDSLGGGNSGTVGKVQWRPSGNYIVNGVSIINPETNEIVTYSFGKDENGNLNPEFNLNNYLKDNVKKGMEIKFHIDKDGTKPTGWIDSSYIVDSLEKSQGQSQEQMDNQIIETNR